MRTTRYSEPSDAEFDRAMEHTRQPVCSQCDNEVGEDETLCQGCREDAGAVEERPPARIDGKRNPEYSQWYRQRNAAALATYNRSEKARACKDRYYRKVKESKHAAGQCTETQTKCIECGMVIERAEAYLRGFRVFAGPVKGGGRGYRCICNECA